MATLRERFENLPLSANQKRFLMFGLVFAVLVAIVWYAVANEEKPRRRAPNPVASTVLTDADTRGVGIDATRADVRKLESQVNELTKRLDDRAVVTKDQETHAAIQSLRDELKELKKSQPDGAAATKTDVAKGENGSGNKRVRSPYDVAAAERALEENAAKSLRPEDVYSRADVESQDVYNGVSTTAGESEVKKEPESPKIRTIEEPQPKEEKAKDDNSDVLYLPSTTMLTGTMITGMDAPTSKQARNDPFPALVRIQKEAILPNNFRADVRDCGMIVGGFGDLSSERVLLRGETISCVRNDGGVIEVSVDAWATGEDGKAGVRGRVVSKQKEYITRAMMAAFVQGASQLFSVQSIPTIRISRGDSDKDDQAAFQQAFNPNAVQGAAVSGVGSALNRISEYYMDMAENLFPVIEIDAGRQIDFIIKKGASLKIKTPPKNQK